jgi:hypothetical protein
LYGRQFEILNYRHNWGEYRVTFYETPDHVSLPDTFGGGVKRTRRDRPKE